MKVAAGNTIESYAVDCPRVGVTRKHAVCLNICGPAKEPVPWRSWQL